MLILVYESELGGPWICSSKLSSHSLVQEREYGPLCCVWWQGFDKYRNINRNMKR